MKKFFGLFGLLIISATAFSQWTWQNPLPQGNSLQSVHFPDAETGYAAGDVGTVMKTTDGGLTWATHTIGTNTLYSVYFTDVRDRKSTRLNSSH